MAQPSADWDSPTASRLVEYFSTCSYPVCLAYLFGSEVQCQTTPLSDLDVAVYLDEPDLAQRKGHYFSLLLELAQVVGNGEVDLVFLNDAPSLFAYQIIIGQLLYSRDEEQRVAFVGRIDAVLGEVGELELALHDLHRDELRDADAGML